MRKLIAGNWKMNGSQGSSVPHDVIKGIGARHENADCVICPPFTLISGMAAQSHNTALFIGAQDCHTEESGAHTGDVSAEMLAEAGAEYVILGHSERRANHGETDAMVSAKAEAALRAKLVPIICLGEKLADREAGNTMDVVLGQLAASLPNSLEGRDFVVAYEPVWAIGTGLTASADQIGEVHLAIREALDARFGAQGTTTQILYGGSMKPGNAAEILSVPNVNGGLIGGASLNAADFLSIYKSAL